MNISLSDFVVKARALTMEGKGDAPMGIEGQGEDCRLVIKGGSFGGRKVKQLATESNKEIWNALENALTGDTPGIRSTVLKDLMDSSKALTARKVLQIINRHHLEKSLNVIEKTGWEIEKTVHDTRTNMRYIRRLCSELDVEMFKVSYRVFRHPQVLERIEHSLHVKTETLSNFAKQIMEKKLSHTVGIETGDMENRIEGIETMLEMKVREEPARSEDLMERLHKDCWSQPLKEQQKIKLIENLQVLRRFERTANMLIKVAMRINLNKVLNFGDKPDKNLQGKKEILITQKEKLTKLETLEGEWKKKEEKLIKHEDQLIKNEAIGIKKLSKLKPSQNKWTSDQVLEFASLESCNIARRNCEMFQIFTRSVINFYRNEIDKANIALDRGSQQMGPRYHDLTDVVIKF